MPIMERLTNASRPGLLHYRYGVGEMGWRGWRCICKCIAIKRLPDLYFAHLPFPSSYLLVHAPHFLWYTVVNTLFLLTQSVCTYFLPDVLPARTENQVHTKWRLTLDIYTYAPDKAISIPVSSKPPPCSPSQKLPVSGPS
jgi:hypothetical protein